MTTVDRTMSLSLLDHPFARFLRMIVTGGLAAAVLNLFVWWLAEGMNGTLLMVQPPGETAPVGLDIVTLLLASIVPAVGAALLFWIIDRFTNSPMLWFVILSIIILVVMYFPVADLSVSGDVKMWLNILHVTTAVGILWAIGYVSGWFPIRDRAKS